MLKFKLLWLLICLTFSVSASEYLPEIVDFKTAAFGVLITIKSENSIVVEKSVNGGSFNTFQHNSLAYKYGGEQYFKVTEPLQDDSFGVQYRIKHCSAESCSEAIETPVINFESYARNVADQDVNGVRDDVDAHIDYLLPTGLPQHNALTIYARNLNKLVSSETPTPQELVLIFNNLAAAYDCVTDEALLIEVKAMSLDAPELFSRYNSLSSDFARSEYANVDVDHYCGSQISTSFDESLPDTFVDEGDVLMAIHSYELARGHGKITNIN